MRRICTTALLLSALSAPAFAQSASYPYGGPPGYPAQQPPQQQYYYAQQPRYVNAAANNQQGYGSAAPQGYAVAAPQNYAAAPAQAYAPPAPQTYAAPPPQTYAAAAPQGYASAPAPAARQVPAAADSSKRSLAARPSTCRCRTCIPAIRRHSPTRSRRRSLRHSNRPTTRPMRRTNRIIRSIRNLRARSSPITATRSRAPSLSIRRTSFCSWSRTAARRCATASASAVRALPGRA